MNIILGMVCMISSMSINARELLSPARSRNCSSCPGALTGTSHPTRLKGAKINNSLPTTPSLLGKNSFSLIILSHSWTFLSFVFIKFQKEGKKSVHLELSKFISQQCGKGGGYYFKLIPLFQTNKHFFSCIDNCG